VPLVLESLVLSLAAVANGDSEYRRPQIRIDGRFVFAGYIKIKAMLGFRDDPTNQLVAS
jgi:hypothetical protein